MPNLNNKSHVRVFFSADLVGSTKLKNQLNHQELLMKYNSRKSVINKLRAQQVLVSTEDEQKSLLESLGVCNEDFDWASVVQSFYRDLNSEFVANIKDFADLNRLDVADVCPWKAVGDELLYQFKIASRRELHWITIAFLSAIRAIDKKVSQTSGPNLGVRIKGTAWTAGFPVRNRVIKLPAVDKDDFLGPDIDTGFRIGKCTQPGMLAISADMAELLSETPGEINPIVGKRVGWEKLKGVWCDHQYPVIWVDLPSGFQDSGGRLDAPEFSPWQQLDCSWCKSWASYETAQPLRTMADDLKKLREGLPSSLGLVKPYIPSDQDTNDEVPLEHTLVLSLLEEIQKHQLESQGQESADHEDSDIPSDLTALLEGSLVAPENGGNVDSSGI